jgi:hypothetical protein
MVQINVKSVTLRYLLQEEHSCLTLNTVLVAQHNWKKQRNVMVNDKKELEMITLPTHVTLSTEDLMHLETTMNALIQGRLDMSQVVIAGEITGKANWLGHFYHDLREKGLSFNTDSPRIRAIGEEAWQVFRHQSPTEAARRMLLIVQSELKEAC